LTRESDQAILYGLIIARWDQPNTNKNALFTLNMSPCYTQFLGTSRWGATSGNLRAVFRISGHPNQILFQVGNLSNREFGVAVG
jgi:hypothetical protein